MNVKRVLLGLTALLIGGGVMAGYELTPKVHAGMPGEAPELGRAGQYPIGTAVAPMTLPGRAEVTALSAISGHATPAMQLHYSTARGGEVKQALARVARIATHGAGTSPTIERGSGMACEQWANKTCTGSVAWNG